MADLERQLRDIQTAARVPQISNASQNLVAEAEDSGTTGRAPASWGDRTIAPAFATLGIVVPVSKRVLFQFGCYQGALTNATAFGYWDFVACGLLVQSAPAPATPPDTTIHLPQNDACGLYVEGTTTVPARSQVNAAAAFILEDLTGHHLQIDMQFYHANTNSAQTYMTWPWAIVTPL